MTLQEFWPQMTELKQDVLRGKYKSRGEISEAGYKIFIRYIGDADEVSRKVVDEFGPYLGFCLITERELLEQDKTKIHRQYEPIIKQCMANMLHIKHANETFEPLPIKCLSEEYDFIDLISGEITEDKKFKLFKWWLFNRVVYYSGRAACYYVTAAAWANICGRAKDMVDQLLAESEEFCIQSGYYDAQNKIAAIDKRVEERIKDVNPDELNKVIHLIRNGRVIKVVD